MLFLSIKKDALSTKKNIYMLVVKIVSREKLFDRRMRMRKTEKKIVNKVCGKYTNTNRYRSVKRFVAHWKSKRHGCNRPVLISLNGKEKSNTRNGRQQQNWMGEQKQNHTLRFVDFVVVAIVDNAFYFGDERTDFAFSFYRLWFREMMIRTRSEIKSPLVRWNSILAVPFFIFDEILK